MVPGSATGLEHVGEASARGKPVPYAPRSTSVLAGCHRSVILGLVVPPKSL
jgi:hypothetical protein